MNDEPVRRSGDWMKGQAEGYDAGVADERARCVKVLEDLRANARGFNTEVEAGVVASIAALVAATPPVPAAPVVPPEPGEAWAGMNLSDDERAGLLSALDDLHGPAATDDTAGCERCDRAKLLWARLTGTAS